MQRQSDLLGIPVRIPESEELSGIGAAYAAGLAAGLFDESVFDRAGRKEFLPRMDAAERDRQYRGWLDAVHLMLQISV